MGVIDLKKMANNGSDAIPIGIGNAAICSQQMNNLLLRQRVRRQRAAPVTDRYVDILAVSNNTVPQQSKPLALSATPPSPPPSPPSPYTTCGEDDDGETRCVVSFAALGPDALELVLAWLSPFELANVALVSRCMHEPIEQAIARRAARLQVSLAPYRGLAQLNFLQAKESAKATAEQREQERLRYLDQVYWGRVMDSIFDNRSAVEAPLADDEMFVYNAQYQAWMPAGADPHAWAMQNLGVTPAQGWS